MGAENLLFPEMKAGPPGFIYRENFVTEEEERTLAASLGGLDLKPFEFHGYLGNRRVASFGLEYDYERRSVEPASAMPPFMDDLLARVAEFAGCEREAFRQVGVNEYRPGAAIGWHKDKPQFGIVVGVSLLAPATMRLRRAESGRWTRISHIVLPRSVYVLSGEARSQWEHSIPPVSDLRYSITFRTLAG
ncbi:MAG TPA: alpha-ketoglutarate-dependent dioxygenase AlkB [Acidobacteriaceae bacterium]|nr:alpha-ketoglutarate-dependent dioxygenase AlkB [Acidobacteriaceae bacterium]